MPIFNRNGGGHWDVTLKYKSPVVSQAKLEIVAESETEVGFAKKVKEHSRCRGQRSFGGGKQKSGVHSFGTAQTFPFFFGSFCVFMSDVNNQREQLMYTTNKITTGRESLQLDSTGLRIMKGKIT